MEKKKYKHILPFHENAKAMDQFGWLPLSIIDPTRESKAQWKDAYIDQTDDEKRRSDDAEYLPGLGMSEFHAGLSGHRLHRSDAVSVSAADPQ